MKTQRTCQQTHFIAQKKSKIIRIGKTKGGHWEIND